MKKNEFKPTLTNLDARILPTANIFSNVPLAATAIMQTQDPVHQADGIYVGDANLLAGGNWFTDAVKKTTRVVAIGLDAVVKVVTPASNIKIFEDPLAKFSGDSVRMKDLKPGDIFLVTSKGLMSSTIHAFTNGPYNHAAIYAGNGKIIHATRKGVHEMDLKEYLKDGDIQRVMVVRVSGLDDAKMKEAVDFARKQIGKSYNNIGAATVTANNSPFSALVNVTVDSGADRSDYYCSQLVAAAFHGVGHKLYKSIEQAPSDLSFLAKEGKGQVIGCIYNVAGHTVEKG